MRRAVAVAVMMLVATMAFAGDKPEHGMYASTEVQYHDAGDGFSEVDNPAEFRVIYMPDNSMVGLVWDYDGDGLADEDVETYEHAMTSQGLVWQEGETWYALYKEGKVHMLMMLIGDETYAVELELVEEL